MFRILLVLAASLVGGCAPMHAMLMPGVDTNDTASGGCSDHQLVVDDHMTGEIYRVCDGDNVVVGAVVTDSGQTVRYQITFQ